MKKLGVMLALAIAVAGCAKAPNGPTTAQGEFRIETLFVHEGCTVYRFHDSGNYRYWTRCEGSPSVETMWSESCGKGCERRHNVATEQKL